MPASQQIENKKRLKPHLRVLVFRATDALRLIAYVMLYVRTYPQGKLNREVSAGIEPRVSPPKPGPLATQPLRPIENQVRLLAKLCFVSSRKSALCSVIILIMARFKKVRCEKGQAAFFP